MDITNIISAMLVLGVLGGLFGFILAVAARKFHVEVDPRQDEILAALPGANCGGCGYPGCSGYAAAVVKGLAPVDSCAAGGAEAAAKIAAVMGLEAGSSERCVALVKCSGFTAKKKFDYSGIDDCVAAMRLGGLQGPNQCADGCMGFGTCVKACPFGAISVKDGVARVDHEKCVGCMACAKACPKHLLVKVPYSADIVVACASKEKGALLRKYCDIGCIGCKICERTCEHGAISIKDNLAEIDYTKCVSCSLCAPKCPRHLIRDVRLNTEGETEAIPEHVSKFAN